MATNIESTELDFAGIRAKLKTHLAAQTEFADYDFEGSAMANILDVLAYNTHYNALTANMAVNEAMLETAQLRGSLVTHAHSLGYYPRSKTTSRATLTIAADLSEFVGDAPTTITLPSGTGFSTTVNSVGYVFYTQAAYTATDPNGDGVYTFTDDLESSELVVYEGEEVTRTFYVPAASDTRHYVINDASVASDTVVVRVYENTTTTVYSTYTNIRNAVRITDASAMYILQETPNGYYELQFTDGGTLGLTPSAGNKIEVSYLRTNAELANNAITFTPVNSLTVESQSMPLSATTSANSSAGAPKESIDSIRLHAPLTYASQRRLVTAVDYYTLIQSNYPSLEDVTAWGGEENVPVDYGKVFISIKFPALTTDESKTATYDDIKTNLTSPLGTLSITPEFIEPVSTYVGIEVIYDFNPSLTGLTSQVMSDRILALIEAYFDDNLGIFAAQFRKSNILTDVDELSPAVLSSKMNVTINQRLTPVLTLDKKYTVAFPVALASPDDENYVITSSRFTYAGETCTLRNKLSTSIIEIVDPIGDVVVNNAGSYDQLTGVVTLSSFAPVTIVGGASYIKVYAKVANEGTIAPLRNYVLELDTAETNTSPTIDYQTTRVSL